MELVSKPVKVETPKNLKFPKGLKRNPLNAEWRKDLRSMSKRWTAIFEKQLDQFPHDITFSVGGKNISGHKFVLSVASPFFQDLICEADKLEQKMIDLPGVDVTAFKNLLRHIYLDDGLVIAEEDLAKTMSVANMFEIPELVEQCTNRLQNILATKNAVTIFQEADAIQNLSLRNKAQEIILQDFQAILNSDDFLCFTKGQFCDFLKSDDLNVPTELELFIGIIRWAKHRCQLEGKDKTDRNIPEMLTGIICHIRMTSISLEDFVEIVEPTNVFSSEEKLKLFRYFTQRKEGKDISLLLQQINLSTAVRKCQDENETVCLISDFRTDGEVDANSFTNDKWFLSFRIDGPVQQTPIYLKGIGFAGRPSKPSEIITMRFLVALFTNWTVGTVLSEEEVTYTAEATKVHMVNLKKSVAIAPNEEYLIQGRPLAGGLAKWKNKIASFDLFKSN